MAAAFLRGGTDGAAFAVESATDVSDEAACAVWSVPRSKYAVLAMDSDGVGFAVWRSSSREIVRVCSMVSVANSACDAFVCVRRASREMVMVAVLAALSLGLPRLACAGGDFNAAFFRIGTSPRRI